MEEKIITREELYKLVWSKPLRQIALIFNLSDSLLCTICRKLEVPSPGLGYWRKVECGKEITKPALLPLSSKGRSSYTIGRRPKSSVPKASILEIFVNEKLLDPHSLITHTMEFFKFSNRTYSDKNTSIYPLKVRSSQSHQNRAFRIMDAFIKAVEQCGYSVSTTEHVSFVLIKNEELWFSLYERRDGRLVFVNERAHGPNFRHEWSDGKRQNLEKMLGAIIIDMERLAEYYSEQTRQYELKVAEKERIELLKRQELEKEKKLLMEVENLQRSRLIRFYTRLSRLNTKGNILDEDWLKWCEMYADKIDPLLIKS